MSRLLVTRPSGFIDRSIFVALRKLRHEVFTLDNHANAKDVFPVGIIETDLENIFEEIKPQAVIQLAAR